MLQIILRIASWIKQGILAFLRWLVIEAPVAENSSLFERFSILILSIQWTVFGSMHFSMHAETIKMMPHWFPDKYKPVIVTVTGMVEVTIGILILLRSTRRLAAFVSLFLLALYIPAVYHILACDSALPDAIRTAFRIALMPNNIFLAICSIHILRNPGASLMGSPAPADRPHLPRSLQKNAGGPAVLLVAALLLMSNCAGFLAITFGIPQQLPTAYLWAMMCIAVGALIGFLFAVPRVNPKAKTGSPLIINTNIEQVSDWLTKIFVGVGLLNFKQIGDFIDRRSVELAATLELMTKSLALSLIGYFLVVGLIQGYLLTRLFLADEFLRHSGEQPSSEG